MATHTLNIAQDGGGSLKKIMHFVKPETFVHYRVSIKNLRTQETFGYDKYHETVESGDYVLIVTDEEGKRVGTKELHLDERSAKTIWILFSNDAFMGIFSMDIVGADEFSAKMEAKRLYSPAGYNGY